MRTILTAAAACLSFAVLAADAEAATVSATLTGPGPLTAGGSGDFRLEADVRPKLASGFLGLPEIVDYDRIEITDLTFDFGNGTSSVHSLSSTEQSVLEFTSVLASSAISFTLTAPGVFADAGTFTATATGTFNFIKTVEVPTYTTVCTKSVSFGSFGSACVEYGSVQTGSYFTDSVVDTGALSVSSADFTVSAPVIVAPPSVPLPAGMPLLLAGLGAFGLAARRR